MEQQALKTGRLEDIPAALKNRPVPSRWENDHWEAFNRLSSSRQFSMGGPTAIPFSEITAYFDCYQITDLDEREDFICLIQALDNVYLNHVTGTK